MIVPGIYSLIIEVFYTHACHCFEKTTESRSQNIETAFLFDNARRRRLLDGVIGKELLYERDSKIHT
jgi:hypothetical protein